MLADPLLTEHYAKAGLRAVLIDQQHGLSLIFVLNNIFEVFEVWPDSCSGLLDERTAFECVQRLEKFPTCFPIVRVADNTPALIRSRYDWNWDLG